MSLPLNDPERRKQQEVEEKVRRLLSEVRAAIVLAGGAEMPDEDLRMMVLGEFFYTAVRNGIRVRIDLDPMRAKQEGH